MHREPLASRAVLRCCIESAEITENSDSRGRCPFQTGHPRVSFDRRDGSIGAHDDIRHETADVSAAARVRLRLTQEVESTGQVQNKIQIPANSESVFMGVKGQVRASEKTDDGGPIDVQIPLSGLPVPGCLHNDIWCGVRRAQLALPVLYWVERTLLRAAGNRTLPPTCCSGFSIEMPRFHCWFGR
jgi:hypothetical protein